MLLQLIEHIWNIDRIIIEYYMLLQLIEHIWNIDRIYMEYYMLLQLKGHIWNIISCYQLIEHIWNIDMENFNSRSTGMYVAWLVELVDVWENFRQSWVSKLINKRVGFLQTPCIILALYTLHYINEILFYDIFIIYKFEILPCKTLQFVYISHAFS